MRRVPLTSALIGFLFAPVFAATSPATPEATFDAYISATNTHDFNVVAPLIANPAIYWFRDKDDRGLDAVRQSFQRTWSIVEDEVYSVHDVQWLVRDRRAAVVVYGYCWTGRVEGRARWGGGLATNVLSNSEGRWAVVHEHLTPYEESRAARCAPAAAQPNPESTR